MKEGQVSPAHVVKLHVRVAPLSVILLEASRNVWDDFWIDRQAGSYVKALKLGEEGIIGADDDKVRGVTVTHLLV